MIDEFWVARIGFWTHIPVWPVMHTSLICLVRTDILQSWNNFSAIKEAEDQQIASNSYSVNMSQKDMSSGTEQLQPVWPVFHIGLIDLHRIREDSQTCNAGDEICRSTRDWFLDIPGKNCKQWNQNIALGSRSENDLTWILWERGELLENEGAGLETWGRLRRSLPHTNPYQEHKSKRLV
jgi:hypothetical protein